MMFYRYVPRPTVRSIFDWAMREDPPLARGWLEERYDVFLFFLIMNNVTF